MEDIYIYICTAICVYTSTGAIGSYFEETWYEYSILTAYKGDK